LQATYILYKILIIQLGIKKISCWCLILAILDVHAHVWTREHIPEKFWQNMASYMAALLKSDKESILNSSFMKVSHDGRGELLIQQMDEAGIDKAVVFGADWGLFLGEAEKSIDDLNQHVSETAARYPDRLIPFFTIDPKRKNAVEQFDHAVSKLEMRGLKLHPTTGFKVTDEETYGLFRKALEFDIPVLSHMGYITGLYGCFTRPHYFDQVTTDFPELRICVAHMNYGDIENLLNLIDVKPNLFVDISAHGQLSLMNHAADFYVELKRFLQHRGDNILFGSDWPMTSNAMTLKAFVEKLRELPKNERANEILHNTGHGRFKNSEIKKVLEKNYKNFLKI